MSTALLSPAALQIILQNLFSQFVFSNGKNTWHLDQDFFIAFITESSYWALEKLQNNQNELEINTIHTIHHSLSIISKVKRFHYFPSSTALQWNNL